MNRPINLSRLFLEIVASIALCELVVMLLLGHYFRGVPPNQEAVLDAALLVLAAGPIILWRTTRAFASAQSQHPRTVVRREAQIVSGLVLVLCLTLTAAVSRWRAGDIEADNRQRFEQTADQIQQQVQQRFEAVLFGLRGLKGLLATNPYLSRAEFRTYVQAQHLAQQFPGARGLGFIERVPRSDLDRYLAVVRADESPDFEVRTQGDAADLFIVRFIEPLESNRAALGFDIGSESARRAAAMRAVESGQPVLTSPVTLIQDQTLGPGLLLILPVLHEAAGSATGQNTPDRLIGLVYAPIVINEIMDRIADGIDPSLDVLLFDERNGETPARVLFRLGGASSLNEPEHASPTHGAFVTDRPMKIADRTLNLSMRATQPYQDRIESADADLIAIAGALLSLLAAIAAWLLATGRDRAISLAMQMTEDLSDAKLQAENTLRDSEALLGTLKAYGIISVTDKSGTIIDANEGFSRISGYSRDELIGHNHRIVKSGVQPHEFWVDMWHTISKGQSWHGIVCNRAKDGSLYWVDSMIAPYLDAAGQVEKYISIRFDITALKQAQAELQQHRDRLSELVDVKTHELVVANRALEEASKAKSAFLAGMSHELRTPLHAILAFADLGRKKGDTAGIDKLIGYFDHIGESGRQMLELVDSLLMLSQFDAGKISFAFTNCDVLAVLKRSMGELTATAATKSLTFDLVSATENTHLIADPVRIEQAMRNILLNAIRFSPQNGTITLTVSESELPGRRHDDPARAAIQITIDDQGPGIPRDELNKIFETFVPTRNAKSAGGFGLGLPLCRHIAETHRGTVWAANRSDGGARLYLLLPYPTHQDEPQHD